MDCSHYCSITGLICSQTWRGTGNRKHGYLTWSAWEGESGERSMLVDMDLLPGRNCWQNWQSGAHTWNLNVPQLLIRSRKQVWFPAVYAPVFGSLLLLASWASHSMLCALIPVFSSQHSHPSSTTQCHIRAVTSHYLQKFSLTTLPSILLLLGNFCYIFAKAVNYKLSSLNA